MSPQEEANIAAAVRGAIAEITMGVNTDASGNGRYMGPCASEVNAARKAWQIFQADRVKFLRRIECPFCRILRGEDPEANIVQEWKDAIAITPQNPITPGHVLVIPRVHVDDFVESSKVTAMVFGRAATLVAEGMDANLIASKGDAATQTVFHFHVHVVPRKTGDNLRLPWSK